MAYTIYSSDTIESRRNIRNLNTDEIIRAPAELRPLAHRVADVLLDRYCLIWYLTPQVFTTLQHVPETVHITNLQQFPLAANYVHVGNLGDQIIVQDPIKRRGPYVFNVRDHPDLKVFHRQGLLNSFPPDTALLDYFPAGDKVESHRRFYFQGDTHDLFEELVFKGYEFHEGR